MALYFFRDVTDTLATGERANFAAVCANTPISARALIQQHFSKNRFGYFGKVFFTNATYADAGKTLTLASAFTRYVFANSARLIITGGTPASNINQEFVIASKNVNNNEITLSGSGLGASADGQSDIDGYIIGGRTIDRLEWTEDDARDAGAVEGSNEAGTGLNRGSAPLITGMTGVLMEWGVAAS